MARSGHYRRRRDCPYDPHLASVASSHRSGPDGIEIALPVSLRTAAVSPSGRVGSFPGVGHAGGLIQDEGERRAADAARLARTRPGGISQKVGPLGPLETSNPLSDADLRFLRAQA